MRILIFLLLAFSIFGCKKTEIETVTGNIPPEDNTISPTIVDEYINRAYIVLLGREPHAGELQSAKSSLDGKITDSIARQDFVTEIFDDPGFLPNMYNQVRIEYLNNTDTAEFSQWIQLFQFYLQDSTYMFMWPLLQYEIVRLTSVRDAFGSFTAGNITLDELQRRACDNYIYDQINMGSANFVIATFQQLIGRNPTQAEQQAGISMVEGNNAVIFLQAGSSKTDYLNILTHSNNYYEGQVIRMYQRYLNRWPSTKEMSDGTLAFAGSGDFMMIQRLLLTTDEFIGL